MTNDPSRQEFEAYWLETRGARSARRKLVRATTQPQTYTDDSANRHWTTWQAARSNKEPEGWRPIGTAPKDGTPIWLWSDHWRGWRNEESLKPAIGRWDRDRHHFNFPMMWEDPRPTHWMPLPDPPAAPSPIGAPG